MAGEWCFWKDIITWETKGHSDGKKVLEASRAIACHISESEREYLLSVPSS